MKSLRTRDAAAASSTATLGQEPAASTPDWNEGARVDKNTRSAVCLKQTAASPRC